jgi:molybdopterin-guanine dinucleotide biosynthesis protein A
MSRDKAFLEIEGETFLSKASKTLAQATGGHVVISVAFATPLHADTGWTLIPDATDLNDHGPIAGVVSAMRWAAERQDFDRIVTLPVDMPFVTAPAVAFLIEGSLAASVAVTGGNPLPTFAIWPLAALDTIERMVREDGVRALHVAQARLDAAQCSLDTFDPLQFVNVNTPEDFAGAAGKR